jgi:hypothetical protein
VNVVKVVSEATLEGIVLLVAVVLGDMLVDVAVETKEVEDTVISVVVTVSVEIKEVTSRTDVVVVMVGTIVVDVKTVVKISKLDTVIVTDSTTTAVVMKVL